jgi:hypothetical protein
MSIHLDHYYSSFDPNFYGCYNSYSYSAKALQLGVNYSLKYIIPKTKALVF